MTCIVGLAYGGRVFMGADSAGVSGWDLTVRADSKLFERGPFLMGFTSSFRMGDLLRYRLEVPEHPELIADREYLATVFVDAVRACLKDGGFATKDKEAEAGGDFLIGYRGHVYTIHGDYQVAESLDGFMAVGCGAQAALGALYATGALVEGCTPDQRIELALKSAERLSAGVRGPFVFGVQYG